MQFEKIQTDMKVRFVRGTWRPALTKSHRPISAMPTTINFRPATYIQAAECFPAGIVSVLKNTHEPTRPNAKAIMCLWVYFNIWVSLLCFSIKDSVNTNFCPPAVQNKDGNDNRKRKWILLYRNSAAAVCVNAELEGGHELHMQGFWAGALLIIHPINLIRGLFIHAGYCKVLHIILTAFLLSALL